jgi:hypothetical protein
MPRWLVVTPDYEAVVEHIDVWPRREVVCDVVEVEAATRREAVVKGVRAMRAQYRDGYHNWYAPDRNPFAGMKAEPADDAPQEERDG